MLSTSDINRENNSSTSSWSVEELDGDAAAILNYDGYRSFNTTQAQVDSNARMSRLSPLNELLLVAHVDHHKIWSVVEGRIVVLIAYYMFLFTFY